MEHQYLLRFGRITMIDIYDFKLTNLFRTLFMYKFNLLTNKYLVTKGVVQKFE